tara:strand:- start:12454 stop:13731 length:1278 start_codon:yes stop_codon:yes gene_type:complete
MKDSKPAFLGGPKSVKTVLNKFNTIGLEEERAVKEVIKTGVLSQYLGCWDKDFFGGPKVKLFEKSCCKYFGVKYSIAVNSWTSGLICAVGATGIEPGEEIIVSTWTMCASATSIIHWNAIPVFADIEPETFNICPKSVEKNITDKTRAILAIDIFGHPCDYDSLNKICDKYGLFLITDSAQAPGAFYKSNFTSTKSHIGGFSLNYHKHIHTGEGGVLVTDNETLYKKMILIRNHGEAVVGDMKFQDLTNIIGYNFRMGEIEAAIGIEQLKKLSGIIEKKQIEAQMLTEGLQDINGLITPTVESNCSHSYYVYPLKIDKETVNVSRIKIIDALKKEGVLGLMNGYANIHRLPMFQKKIAYGSNGFPWSHLNSRKDINYKKGICPVAEELHDKTFLGIEICLHEYDEKNIQELIFAFKKVFNNLTKI